MNDSALNIKISKELKEKVDLEASKKNIPSAAFVRMVLSEYFERKENGLDLSKYFERRDKEK